jgi:hypothetical protein
LAEKRLENPRAVLIEIKHHSLLERCEQFVQGVAGGEASRELRNLDPIGSS